VATVNDSVTDQKREECTRCAFLTTAASSVKVPNQSKTMNSSLSARLGRSCGNGSPSGEAGRYECPRGAVRALRRGQLRACSMGATDVVDFCRCASVRQGLEDLDMVELFSCLCLDEVIGAGNHLTAVVDGLELSESLADLFLHCCLDSVQKGLLLGDEEREERDLVILRKRGKDPKHSMRPGVAPKQQHHRRIMFLWIA